MMNLSERTIGDIAVEIPSSIPIFEQWGIDYCCGGKTPVETACKRAGKSVMDLAEALKNAPDPDSGLNRDWSNESLGSIAAFIVDAYHRYTREELDLLTALAIKVEGVHGANHAELTRVRQLVEALGTDMRPHMLKEEQILFPYVDQLDRARRDGAPAPTPFFGTVKNPVRMMMLEHDGVGELLTELRRVTSSYETPEDACFSYRELYRRLPEFETRTHEHIHLENNLYFPAAVALEEQAGKTADFAEAAHACGCQH